MGASNTVPSIFSADLSKVYRKTHECRVFLKNIGINLYSKSTRFLYCYFWLRGKPVENTSLSLLIISPRSLHNFWNFPRYANHRCTGHATMSTERGNDPPITVHAPSCLQSRCNFSSSFVRWIYCEVDSCRLCGSIFLDKPRKRNHDIVGEFAIIFETVVGVEIGSKKVRAL